MDEQVVRSAPDALRDTPGVSVQQTAHGQASPFIRGVTGQQVLLLFDGLRLNNGLYRQGPNQYFFTVDAGSIDRIEIERGSASVLYGSDAIGGVVMARPVEPRFYSSVTGLAVRPSVFGTYASADTSLGGRAEVEAQVGQRVAAVVGVGYRVANQLRGGQGGVRDLSTGALARTPTLAEDNATQLGTGYREFTFDGRLLWRITARLEAVAAVYGFRQFDAPRTDQCPPTWASSRACLVYEEQFRTLAYGAIRGELGPNVRELSITAGYQRSHERRRFNNPDSTAARGWIDDLDTVSVTARAATARAPLTHSGSVGAVLRYGADVSLDTVSSSEWLQYNQTQFVVDFSRGQYVSGSRYSYGGVFSEVAIDAGDWMVLRAGVRGAFATATSPGDMQSQTRAIERTWTAGVARGGLELKPSRSWALFVNIDQGFRPPNLDDLTSRQVTGPGFQLENPELEPERSTTAELGTRVRSAIVDVDLWTYAMRIDHAMIRALKSGVDCPMVSTSCSGATTRLQLQNVIDPAILLGFEGSARARLGRHFELITGVSYAWGEAKNTFVYQMPTLPLSRVPPLHGTVEARFNGDRGLYVSGVVRWALDQSRLAIQDLSDPRIPAGGTPGYAVFDVRFGVRVARNLRINGVVENLFDSAWRVHGSSINGPGRGVLIQAAAGF
jgi:iron complex outermembrane receptor protein/hemoglobin/transferrin/lactoferrin receptor protein